MVENKAESCTNRDTGCLLAKGAGAWGRRQHLLETQMLKHMFFSRKMKEERIMWNAAVQFLSFMLRELPKEKFLSNKSEAWVVFQMFSFIYDSCLHLMSNVFSLKSGIATGWSNRCNTLMILKNKNTSVCSSSFGLWGPSVQACGNFTEIWSPNLFIVDLFMYLYARALVQYDNVYRKFSDTNYIFLHILIYQAKK